MYVTFECSLFTLSYPRINNVCHLCFFLFVHLFVFFFLTCKCVHFVTLPLTPHLLDNMVLAIAGSTVGGALLLVVTTGLGVLLCMVIMKLKLNFATDKLQSKLHTFNMNFTFCLLPST